MKLKDYLYFSEITITDFAKTVGVSRHHMSGIVNGSRKPSMAVMKNIEYSTQGKVTQEDLIKKMQ